MANWKPLLPGLKGAAGWEDAPFPEARPDLNGFQVPRHSGWISAQLPHLSHSLAGPQLGAVSALPTGAWRGSGYPHRLQGHPGQGAKKTVYGKSRGRI